MTTHRPRRTFFTLSVPVLLSLLAVRLIGGPAVLITLTGFGALRGMQDMRTPFWIAGGRPVGVVAGRHAARPLRCGWGKPLPDQITTSLTNSDSYSQRTR